MNSQRTDDNKNKAASAVFTKETLGVVIVLFATLCLVCLITKDAVFSAPGKYVGDFLMGVFGYFAFPIVFFTLYKGAMLVIGKKIQLPLKRKTLAITTIILVALFAHVLSMGKGTSFSDYISASYSRGEGGFSAGGAVAALVAYYLQALLTVVGSAVVLGVLTALCVYFLVTDIINEKKSVSPAREFRSTFVKNETAETSELVETSSNQAAGFSDRADMPEKRHVRQSQKLFINNGGDFSFKTKREIAKDDGSSFKVDSSAGALNVSEMTGTYSENYNRDLQKKLEYVKTPAKIVIEKTEKPAEDTASPRVSDYISVRDNAVGSDGGKENTEIPMIEHEETYHSDARSRAAAFGEKYAVNFNSDFGARATETEKPPLTPEKPAAEEPKAEEEVFSVSDKTEENTEQTNNVSEIPPTTRIRDGRARSILFDDEKPSFTSRAQADGNGRRGFVPEFSEVKEEAENYTDAEEESEISEKPEKPPVPINRVYYKPPLDLLETYTPPADAPKENHEERIETIRRVLEEFHISVEPQGYIQGPTVTRYEVKMPAGIPVKKVLAYDDDLKMRLLSKSGVRIEAPIPGKDGVGIEVANRIKITVGLKEVLEGAAGQKVKSGALMFALGKDIVGNSITDNLAKGPHYLVAGATGSGKSVCLNVMIVSMLMRYSPEELRLILIDPKRVGFRKYEHLPHLMIDEIITEPQKAVAVLQWAYKEMERRYDEFAKTEGGLVSDIESYNEIVASDTVAKMPRIVIVVDELADLMETCKKDMETNIRLLAQKARAAGIHLVLATQRPSVDVVTGTIKANLPSRIALKVMNSPDSITILSEGGAEKLLGNGDMLYKNSGMSEPERYQGAWISDREISNIVTYIKEKNAAYFDDELKNYLDKAVRPKQEETENGVNGDDDENDGIDEFFLKALWLAVTSNSVSISQLQRRFQIGYARAGGLVDKMERLGFVSGNEGSKARRVLLSREEFENRFGSMPDSY